MDKGALLMVGNYLTSSRHNRNIWHSLAERLRRNGWKVITTSDKENKLLRMIDMMVTILRKRADYSLAQIDIFSGQAFIFAEICTWLLTILKKPVVFTLHGGMLPEFAQAQPRRVNRLLKKATAVVTPSPYLQKEMYQYRKDIRLILNPVDIGRFLFQQRKNPQPNILWLRAFHRIYNPQLAVRAIKELVPDYPELRLAMIGPDEGDGSLAETHSLIQELCLTENIFITPGIPYSQVPDTLTKFDLFINTSNYDTAPRCILESMANGMCIVTTNVGGIPWLVTDQKEALLVAPNDPKAMANAIRQVLENPNLAASLSTNASKRAGKYDWGVVLPHWEELFNEIFEKTHAISR